MGLKNDKQNSRTFKDKCYNVYPHSRWQRVKSDANCHKTLPRELDKILQLKSPQHNLLFNTLNHYLQQNHQNFCLMNRDGNQSQNFQQYLFRLSSFQWHDPVTKARHWLHSRDSSNSLQLRNYSQANAASVSNVWCLTWGRQAHIHRYS